MLFSGERGAAEGAESTVLGVLLVLLYVAVIGYLQFRLGQQLLQALRW